MIFVLGCDAELPGTAQGPRAPVAPNPTALLPDTGTPPPLAGGTLLVTRSGTHAVASDPDTDRIVVVDLTRARVAATLALRTGDEPGRLAEDADGRVHVVLRGAGALVSVDVLAGSLGERRPVCALPRGIAVQTATGELHVACAEGDLVTLAAAGGPVLRRIALGRDLRDVVMLGNERLVTHFRSAEALVVDSAGVVVRRLDTAAGAGQSADVAWRAAADPAGGAWVLHQRTGNAPTQPITITTRTAGAYLTAGTTSTSTGAEPCRGTLALLRPGLTLLRPGGDPVVLPDVADAALAVDLAVSPDGASLALAVPGNFRSARPSLLVAMPRESQRCLGLRSGAAPSEGQVVAVAWHPGGALLAQTREPAALFVQSTATTIPLGGPVVRSAGHTVFHSNPGGAITCASCHPEGDDDGRTWTFAPAGPRRTMPLRGGVMARAPFHWSGDLPDLASLVSTVAVRNMGMPELPAASVASLGRWLDALPLRVRPSMPADAVARGRALYNDPVVACATCHGGEALTNNQLADVGTGEALQVPTLLGLAGRAPYMHDGCARTLADRFQGDCGGGDRHGRTSHLTRAQLDDLVAYLETL